MHASSFDTHLDEPSEWMGTVTMRGTLMTYEDSDQESASSYITGIFHPVDPEDLRDASCQTPGHARTQTDGARSRDSATQVARSTHTQTADLPRSSAVQTSNTSLHSIGAQTKRSSGSRSDLLRSILMEVKDIKRQQGVDTDSVRDDDASELSGNTIRRETLQELYQDVHALRAAGARGNAATQTQSGQATQTSLRLFPEGDSTRSARHGRLQDVIDEMRHMRGSGSGARSTSPLQTPLSHRVTNAESPFDVRGHSASLGQSSPSRLDRGVESPHPLSSAPAVAAASGPLPQSGHAPYPPAFGASYVPPPAPGYAYPPGYAYGLPPSPPEGMAPLAGRRVTQEALNNISERLDRLRSYQVPTRRSMPVLPPPPPPPQPRTLPEPPRRYRVREFARSYDDMDVLLDVERRYSSSSRRRDRSSRSVSERYHLDGLDEALLASQQLKRMSRKVKKTLRNELMKY